MTARHRESPKNTGLSGHMAHRAASPLTHTARMVTVQKNDNSFTFFALLHLGGAVGVWPVANASIIMITRNSATPRRRGGRRRRDEEIL